MIPFSDPDVTALYYIVRDEEEPMINHSQRQVLSMLGGLTLKDNRDAVKAGVLLLKAPLLHPHLREQLRELRKEIEEKPKLAGNQASKKKD
ncbi:MAG TPA: hypothetical protein VMW63_06280 [Methanoregulaceae archaeon]|nr:hypothetical protein [Methanoregulaceae archaeon]